MVVTIDTNKVLPYVLAFGIGVAVGWFACSNLRATSEHVTTNEPNPQVGVTATTSTVVDYVPKTETNNADVVDNTKSHVVVSVNDTEYTIPTDKVNETHKFENGQLVINRDEVHTIDLTDVTNELAKEKYSRVGKVDFGVLYADNELYGGVRYNAKAWDATYWHSVGDSKQGVSLFYKF